MTARYPVLRYPGNVTGSDQAQPGVILGWDEFGRPYEVIDAEFVPDGSHFGEPAHTDVFLQYATPEAIRAHREAITGVHPIPGHDDGIRFWPS